MNEMLGIMFTEENSDENSEKKHVPTAREVLQMPDTEDISFAEG